MRVAEERAIHAPAPVIPARWMSTTLSLAAVYNLVWGAMMIAFPGLLFAIAGMEAPRYPQIWQCVGMIVGVYGVGYAVAARDPYRHWPIVLVGFLGKVFGPIGFLGAAVRGDLPWSFGLTILTNDLVWLAPFALILLGARRAHLQQLNLGAPLSHLRAALAWAEDQRSVSLLSMSRERPLLVVLLRHAGCTFCREALADIGTQKEAIEAEGVGVVLVHMGVEDASTAAFMERYGVADVSRVSDPDRTLYRAFGLLRGRFGQLFGLRVWIRGLGALLRGHRVGRPVGDGFQMPGVFVVVDGRVVVAHRHASASDRPDYLAMARRVSG